MLMLQVSKVVQKFYECLMRGEEYTDDAWQVWESSHPADVAAKSPSKGGAATGAGRGGNCYKYIPQLHCQCFKVIARVVASAL